MTALSKLLFGCGLVLLASGLVVTAAPDEAPDALSPPTVSDDAGSNTPVTEQRTVTGDRTGTATRGPDSRPGTTRSRSTVTDADGDGTTPTEGGEGGRPANRTGDEPEQRDETGPESATGGDDDRGPHGAGGGDGRDEPPGKDGSADDDE